MQWESTEMVWGPEEGRSGRVESAVLRLFRLPEVDSGGGTDIERHPAEWNRRLSGQRSRIARQLSLIDARLGLDDPQPVLSVVGST